MPTAPLRFAHPFFTPAAIERRRPHPPYGRRLQDHIRGQLQAVPVTKGKGVITLADVIGQAGAAQIAQGGTLRFHSAGDTGRRADSPHGDVARAMTQDFTIEQPAQSPAFFFHLGDVIYGTHKDQSYRREFYEPYVHYPGKIIAIPGNHDGEVIPGTDPATLRVSLLRI